MSILFWTSRAFLPGFQRISGTEPGLALSLRTCWEKVVGQASRLPLGRLVPVFSRARRPFIAGRRPALLFFKHARESAAGILKAHAVKSGVACNREFDAGRRSGQGLPRSTQRSHRFQEAPAGPGQLQFVPVADKLDYRAFRDQRDGFERERGASVAIDGAAIDRPREPARRTVTPGADEKD